MSAVAGARRLCQAAQRIAYIDQRGTCRIVKIQVGNYPAWIFLRRRADAQ